MLSDGWEGVRPFLPFFPLATFTCTHTHTRRECCSAAAEAGDGRILSTGRKEIERVRLVGRWIASKGEGGKWMMVFLSSKT